jgi:hypothetical protein
MFAPVPVSVRLCVVPFALIVSVEDCAPTPVGLNRAVTAHVDDGASEPAT